MYPDGYIPPILTADTVIFQLVDSELQVLLIQRTQEPFKGAWALPGGYNAIGETTRQAASRVLKIKAGLDLAALKYVEQLYTFDTVARDPRGHAVSVTYLGLGQELSPRLSASTQNPNFFSINKLPRLAYDHTKIINYAHQRLRDKLSYTSVVFALLSEKFSLSQLQNAYEAVLGHKLDKRNFRKKYLEFGLIQPTNEYRRDGAHRPARLYRFKDQTLQNLGRSFD